MATRALSFTLNGAATRLTVDEDRPLLWVLRDDLGLTGTKFGCGEAHCGSCTVLVDDRAVRACATPVREVEGKRLVTVEGLAREGVLHPVQDAFLKHLAYQCGFCTPGMILGACALLHKTRGRPARTSCGRSTPTCAAVAPTCGSSTPSSRRRPP